MCVLCLCASMLGPGLQKGGQVRHVPVLMYHSVCKTGVGAYVCAPETLRQDMKYLKERGYKSVFVRDIVDFCRGVRDLPKKCVVLTFDDGFYNNLYYVEPIAAQEGMKITVSVVGSFIERQERDKAAGKKSSPVYSYLSLADIRAMHKRGRTEFCNHTYDMHHPSSPRRGMQKKKGESAADYAAAVTKDSEKCRNLLLRECGVKLNVFTYPFGYCSTQTASVLQELHYSAILTCKEGINRFTKGSKAGLYSIMRYNRPGTVSTAQFFKRLGI